MNRKISVSMGKTINIGNYESLRIDCLYEMDVSPDLEIDRAYALAWQIVEAELSDKIKQIKGGEK